MKAEGRRQKVEENGFGQFEREGFQIIESLVSDLECEHLAAELTPLLEKQLKSAKNRIGGLRNLLRTNALVSAFAKSPLVTGLIHQVAGCEAFPVRAIFFDKNPQTNWLVPWHQDLAIAVAEQIETPGFTGWSVKDGIVHVHPPEDILAGMIALRLHLDDCDASNGALRLIAGSHRFGKIPAGEVSRRTSVKAETICEVAKGGALLLRPLLLHASSPAETPCHRRVLHIEFATQKLPNRLEWLDN
jgi:ectoine hydroxylase-related dioxygenase (phytanoyl-CoA dioxygenase family)